MCTISEGLTLRSRSPHLHFCQIRGNSIFGTHGKSDIRAGESSFAVPMLLEALLLICRAIPLVVFVMISKLDFSSAREIDHFLLYVSLISPEILGRLFLIS